ncbi:MAG: response regulator [Clostridia bacterium]|nr:response regulator [Clostridia bacterium]
MVYVKAFFMKISNEFCMHHDVANLATNGCYVVSDKDYSILYVNQRLEHFLHKKGVEGIIGKKCYSVIQNREYPCENCAIRLKKPSEMLGDRSKQTYIVTPHEMIWDDNKSTIVYLNDITDQRREEQRTLEAKKNLSIAMEHAKMLYWEYEFETSRAYVNEITQRSFGIPAVMEDYPECFLKMNFISDEYRQTYRENVYRMKSGEEYIEFTVKVKTLQQDQVWMKLRLTGVKDGEGNPVRAICTAEVITEYKELEQRFQAIMKQNSISTWLYDIPRHTILLNNDSRNFPLYKDQYEVANVPEAHSIDGFCHPEDMDRLRKLYHDIENGSKQATATVRFWNALENRYRWQRCSYTVISDRDGKPVYAVGSSSDVTEQVETKERYRKAVELREHTKADNILLSCHCNISENRIMELEDQTGVHLLERFGDVRDTFFGKMGEMIIDTKKQKEFYDTFLSEPAKQKFELGHTQSTFECGISFEKDHKNVLWVQIQMTVVKVPETNELEGFMSVADITESKRQEYILETVIHWDYDFVANVNLIMDQLVIYRTQSSEMEFDWCKAGIAYSYSEGVERAIHGFVVESDQESYRKQMSAEYIKKKLEEKDIFEFVYHIVRPDGEIRVKRARFTEYEDSEEFVVFSRTDITDIITEEEEKRKNLAVALELAEQAARAKSDFLSRMSHDLRTPMNGILGLTYLMEEQTDIKEIKDSIPRVREAGEYLMQLINDVLDVNKIESGEITLFPRVCNEEKVFPSIITMITPQLEHKSIDFHFDKTNITWKYLFMDEQRVRQIFINLLSNAIKFTPNGGRIDFSMECVAQKGDVLTDKFVIRDTGIGISKEFMPKIFEPFTQENRFITSNTQGTGLGMAIVQKLVELMNGTISVRSELDKGTEFTVYLDFKMAEEQEEEEAPKTLSVKPVLPKGVRVLLCEDHPLNAKIARGLLERQGAVVSWANNGKIGVEMFSESKPNEYDIILMDIRMPKLDGLGAAQAIRSLDRPDAGTIPIIAMTANAFEEDVRKSELVGMNAHLSKPIQPAKMYETIVKYLRR